MAPDLITLSVIRHEDSRHRLINTLAISSTTTKPLDIKTPVVTECEIISSNSPPTVTSLAMGNANDARTRALASMYSTGFVFGQNQKQFVKALPWSNGGQGSEVARKNSVPSTEELSRAVAQFAQGRGNGRKAVVEEQLLGLRNQKVKDEHASSMFALLT